MKEFIKEHSKILLYKSFSDYLGTQFFPSSSFLEEKFGGFGGKDNSYLEESYKQILSENHKINLYVHIPFCKTKCYYCHCYKHLSQETDDYSEYIDFLEKEIKIILGMLSGKKPVLNSIFIGGGTPNLIGNANIKKLLSVINSNFDLDELKQYNIDINPYHVDEEQIQILSDYGVNRCTYAIQTFDTEILKQNSRYFEEGYDHTYYIKKFKEAGIDVNLDLMVGIKGQTLESCINDINVGVSSGADNVSLNYFIQSANVNYVIDKANLELVYKIKSYYNTYINGKFNSCFNMQEDNYLKSKVNLIGIGNGAISHLFEKVHYYNDDAQYYYDSINDGKLPAMKGLKLTLKDEMIKYIWLNSVYGIELGEFEKFFEIGLFEAFTKEMDFLISEGIFALEGNTLSTKVSNVKLYLYLTVFLKKYVPNVQVTEADMEDIDMKLVKFFLRGGEKIDEDF